MLASLLLAAAALVLTAGSDTDVVSAVVVPVTDDPPLALTVSPIPGVALPLTIVEPPESEILLLLQMLPDVPAEPAEYPEPEL